jgi:glycosyltransferase involved in cell wall biosynthesis
MRIAIWHNLPSGGGKRALYDQVESLLRRGHEIESWCPPSADQDFLPLREIITEHVVDCRQPSSRWTAVRQVVQDTNAHIEAMDRHCRQCAEEITERGFDVLFANACMKFRTTSIGRFTELPSVLYLGEPYRWLYEASPEPPWAADDRLDAWMMKPREIARVLRRSLQMRLNQIQIREEVRNAGAFNLIACNSQYSRESILRAYGISAEVCYLGIDENRFMPNEHEDARKPFFLTVGAAVTEKNVPFLIRALAHRQDTSWPLVWVANLADRGHVDFTRRLADELGVPLDVRISVSHTELLSLYREAGLFLYSPRLEPFGLAPLEAAACGLPVVAVAEAGVRETVSESESGFLVEASEVAFAAKIDEVLGQPELLRSITSKARAYVETHWRLDEAAIRLESLLARASTLSEKER